MTTSGPNSAGTGANDASAGVKAWTKATAVTASDNSYATISSSSSASNTQYLKCTNFNFAVPAGATVNGITVEAELAEQDGFGGTVDLAVRIVKGGTIGSTDKSRAGSFHWPSPDSGTYVTYGSSSDLWGETWAYSDINSSTFGFAIRAQYAGAKTFKPRVDHVRITVTYTAGGVTVNTSSTMMW
jgi:hypothetical protein